MRLEGDAQHHYEVTVKRPAVQTYSGIEKSNAIEEAATVHTYVVKDGKEMFYK